jgi:Ni/Fe-hydrogenase 1 B-type cytochrome subunit
VMEDMGWRASAGPTRMVPVAGPEVRVSLRCRGSMAVVDERLVSYRVWDAPTRWFHWINAFSVLGLILVGVLILSAGTLGVSPQGRVAIKTIHVWLGYVMVVNLLWRVVWAFLGNRYARWHAILPGGPGYWRAFEAYLAAFLAGHPKHYLGHNPVGRLAVLLILLLLIVQGVTGLVLAGTDIFYPPFGGWIAHWIAASNVDPSTLTSLNRNLMDPSSYAAMRSFRTPFVEVHEFTFYVLSTVAGLHIVAVVVTELREGGTIVSAMFTGQKILSSRPEDVG